MTADMHLPIGRSRTVEVAVPPHGVDRRRVDGYDELVLAAAQAAGFCLDQRELHDGLLVWEWRRGSEPRPQFVTRRVALHWMSEFLNRDTPAAYVSNTGAAYEERPS